MGSTVSKQIEYVEDCIKLKRKLGKDATFEKDLVKSWKLWKRKHGDKLEYPPDALQSKSGHF